MGICSGTPRAIRDGLLLPKLLWITLVFQSLFVNLTMQSTPSGPNIVPIGEIYPSGDIVLEYGNGVPLEITCVLNPENIMVQKMILNSVGANLSEQPSQKIEFYKNLEFIPEKYVSIINSTAAKMRLVNPPVGQDNYNCALLYDGQKKNHSNNTTTVASEPSALETNVVFSPTGEELNLVTVAFKKVSVGYKPLEVTNFTCTSYNWENLHCNWTNPLNPVKTTYKIFFKLPGRSGGRMMAKCPMNSDITDNTCYWDISTSPMYRLPYEYYFFTLYGENALGNSSTTFRFHHYANVIPAKPLNVIATHTTQSSVMLKWSLGLMAYFPQKLIHKIEYGSRRNSSTEGRRSVKFAVRPNCNSSSVDQFTSFSQKFSKCYVAFNITDLKYPFTDYDFQIYVRTSAARGEDKWSAPESITVKTKPTIPRNPPKIDVGSFECIPSKVDQFKRDVLIYWQGINDDEKCGDMFHYLAYYTSTTPDNKTIIHHSNKTYENYAVFKGLSASVGYNFTVFSSNNEGLSTGFSTIYVPSESQKLQKPLAVTLMTFDEHGDFEMSWENADNRTSSTTNELNYYYTLFWCEKSIDYPNQCDGHMNSISVPGFKSWYNITGLDNKKNYRFAISSNSFTENDQNQSISLSSGMAQESCRVLYGKSVENFMGLRVGVIGTDFVALKWSFNCTERIGFVSGYHIDYCPSDSRVDPICNGTMLTKIIDKDILQKENCIVILTRLKPLTMYMFRVSVITDNNKGLIYSETIFNSTLGLDLNENNETRAKKYGINGGGGVFTSGNTNYPTLCLRLTFCLITVLYSK